MKWNKKKALEIQAAYNLTDVTVRNWKMRGYIPDQYRGMKYVPPVPASPKRLRKFEKIIQQNCFVRRGFGLPQHRYRDHLLGGGNALIRVEEMDTFFGEVEELRKRLEAFILSPTDDGLRGLLQDKRIRASIFLEHPKLIDRLRKKYPMKPADFKYAQKRSRAALKFLK